MFQQFLCVRIPSLVLQPFRPILHCYSCSEFSFVSPAIVYLHFHACTFIIWRYDNVRYLKYLIKCFRLILERDFQLHPGINITRLLIQTIGSLFRDAEDEIPLQPIKSLPAEIKPYYINLIRDCLLKLNHKKTFGIRILLNQLFYIREIKMAYLLMSIVVNSDIR